VPVCQLRMIHAETMQNRCLQIVNVNWVFRDFQTQIVRSANYLPASYATSRKPEAETVGMMVAAGTFVHFLELAQRCPA